MSFLLFIIFVELFIMNQRSEAPAAPRPAQPAAWRSWEMSRYQEERFAAAAYWFRAGLEAIVVGGVLFFAILALCKIVLAF